MSQNFVLFRNFPSFLLVPTPSSHPLLLNAMSVTPAAIPSNEDPLSLDNGPHLFVGTMPYADDSRYSVEDIYKAVSNNLKAGVRHIDTAELYAEALPYVNMAIRDSRVKRHQLFVCSKLKGLPNWNYADVRKALRRHLTALGIDSLDLLLIHWPGLADANFTKDPDTISGMMSWTAFDSAIDKAWENMVQLKSDGLTKQIGVSNFYRQHLHRLINSPVVKESKEQPTVNQIYLDATQHQFEFVQEMQKIGLQVMCYRPLQFLPALKTAGAMGDTVYRTLEDLKVKASVDTDFKSVEQLVLSWLFARGVHVVVKSSNYNHIRENFASIKKAQHFPTELVEEFPEPTDLSTMVLAYDAYAEMFQNV